MCAEALSWPVTGGVTLGYSLYLLFLISSDLERLRGLTMHLQRHIPALSVCENMAVFMTFCLNCNLLIWKQFKAFKPIGFLIIPSNYQAHSCLRAIAFTVPTLWTALPLDVSRAVALNPLALHLDITFSAHLPWPPRSSMSCCSFLLYLFVYLFIHLLIYF